MNERIRELALQAGHKPLGTFADELMDIYNKKFAELIVNDCCEWIDNSPTTESGQLILTKSFIIANLKGNFGVSDSCSDS